MTWCPEMEKMVGEEPFPEYNDEFNEMTEREKESIGYDESQDYLVDKDGYDKLQEKHHQRLANHMVNCNHKDCQNTLSNWKNDKELNKYIQNTKED